MSVASIGQAGVLLGLRLRCELQTLSLLLWWRMDLPILSAACQAAPSLHWGMQMHEACKREACKHLASNEFLQTL